MKSIAEQIKDFRERKNLSMPLLSRLSGISKENLYKWEKGHKPSDYKDVKILLDTFEKWNDVESITLSTIENEITKPYHELRKEKKLTDKSPNEIVFTNADFSAGSSIEFYDDTQMIQSAYTMDIPEFKGTVAFRAYGDSMEPTIKSGSIVFATKIEDWNSHLEYGQVYGIVCTDNRRYLKYIRKSKKQDTHFLLKSENEFYDDFELPKDKIKNIWLIHGWLNKRT